MGSDPVARARYDRGEGVGGNGLERAYDFSRARDMFNANFGESLMRQWQPGMCVSGTLVRNGKRTTITIHPDGQTEESESVGGSSNAAYTSVSTTLPGGGHMQSIHF